MKYTCGKCGKTFDSIAECMAHENICGLPEDQVVTFLELGVKATGAPLTKEARAVPRDQMYLHRRLGEVYPGDNGSWRVNVLPEDERRGMERLLLAVAKKKIEEMEAMAGVLHSLHNLIATYTTGVCR